MLLVDTRWRGRHGIARYATEVLSRLQTGTAEARLHGRPGSAQDLLSPRLFPGGTVIYTPGYNAAPSRARQVVTVHDLIHLSERSAKHSAYYNTVLKPAIRRAGVVLTVSETSQRAIAEWLNDDSIEIVNCGNGLSATFKHEDHSPQRSGLLYVGNLKPHKNFGVLLAALEHNPQLTLRVVTPDPDAVIRLAKHAGVESRVTPLAGLSDAEMAREYANSTATVLPSLLEGFGLPALESIALGTPVIYWRGCESVAEIVGTNGWALDSPNDAKTWSDAMTHVAEAPLTFDPAPVIERYSWDRVAAAVDAVLENV